MPGFVILPLALTFVNIEERTLARLFFEYCRSVFVL